MAKPTGKDVAGAACLAVVALVGHVLVHHQANAELDLVRGMRVALEARKALQGKGRPEGTLTVVKETESAKYYFLNKRSYVVHTASTAREGTVLRGDEPLDKARADRHAEVRRKKTALRTPLESGAWRVTVAEKGLTAELESSPPPVEQPVFLSRAALAFLFGALTLLVARLRLSTWGASLLGLAVTSGALIFFAEGHFAEASRQASAYLASVGASAPQVNLPRVGVRAWLGGLAVLGAALTLFVSSTLGGRAASAMSRDRGAYAAISPAMLGLGVLVGVPFLFGIALSFFRHRHGTYTFVGLQNFANIILDPARGIFEPQSLTYSLTITVVWTALNVALHLSIGLLLALLLQKRAASLSKIYRVILIIPWAVPGYLTALIWKSMFDPDIGAVNRMLGLEGMSWMHNALTAFLANLITNVWLGFPFMMVVCLGALTSIPTELYEAADVDGASKLQQFVRITLPLLKPALLPAVILGSIWTFNKFEVIYLVSEGKPDGATEILVTEAYKWAFERGLAQGGAYGYAAAYSVIIFLVLLIYGWMTSRVARAAEEALR